MSFLAWKEIQQKSIFLRLKEDQELNHLVHRLQTLKKLIHNLSFLLRKKNCEFIKVSGNKYSWGMRAATNG